MISPLNSPLLQTAICLLLAGCATSPKPSPAPDIVVPKAWSAAPVASTGAPEAWLNDFDSPELAPLVSEALVHNADLHSAAARFAQSIAEARIAGADQLPSVGLGLNGTRQKISSFGPTSTGGIRFDNYDLALNLGWELDLWGQLRNRTSAALALVEGSQAELRGARLSLAAQVSKSWFNYSEAQQQLALAQRTAQAYAENLKTFEARYRRGLSEGLDLRRIRTQSASAEAEVQSRRRALDYAARSLEILLGRYPAANIASTATLPELPKAIPSGLPADLLNRRPDLITAERRLAAVDKELSATRKDLLPKISLTTSGGSSSQEFNNLLDSDFSIWSLGANLTQPIFQGGRILANIDRSKALREQATANYRSTALRAFLEVESTLAAERFLQNEHAHLARAAKEATATEQIAWDRYRNGTTDFINVLDTQRTANASRSRLLAIRNLLLQNRIDLYLALGGPFEPES